jgi:hypothetical protein
MMLVVGDGCAYYLLMLVVTVVVVVVTHHLVVRVEPVQGGAQDWKPS